jgi:hypothetical protein
VRDSKVQKTIKEVDYIYCRILLLLFIAKADFEKKEKKEFNTQAPNLKSVLM